MLSKKIKKETYVDFFFVFWAVKKSKNVISTNRADGFTKTFPKLHRSLMEGMELKLCFVTSLLSLNMAAFRSASVARSFEKVLDLRPRPHVFGYFWIRKFSFSDSKISPSTRSLFKSNSPVHTHHIGIHYSTQGSSVIKMCSEHAPQSAR